jgi:hypothetical protein
VKHTSTPGERAQIEAGQSEAAGAEGAETEAAEVTEKGFTTEERRKQRKTMISLLSLFLCGE